MTIYHPAYDEAQGKNTIIIQNSYGYMIFGQDQKLHEIDSCTANYYIILYAMQEN